MPSPPCATDTQVANAEELRCDPDDEQAPSGDATAPSTTQAAASSAIACPSCHGSLGRIWRRPGDRILSIFTPLARYRCASHDCRWEGNLRAPQQREDSASNTKGRAQRRMSRREIPVMFIVHMALAILAAAFVFVVAAANG